MVFAPTLICARLNYFAKMFQFSFIDFGNRDFIRDDEDKVLMKEFSSWEAADDFIMDGGLDNYAWTNSGIK